MIKNKVKIKYKTLSAPSVSSQEVNADLYWLIAAVHVPSSFLFLTDCCLSPSSRDDDRWAPSRAAAGLQGVRLRPGRVPELQGRGGVHEDHGLHAHGDGAAGDSPADQDEE